MASKKGMEALPLWLKIIIALPMLDIIWMIYRAVRSYRAKNGFGLILAIVFIFIGIPFVWLIDIISLLLKGRVLWID